MLVFSTKHYSAPLVSSEIIKTMDDQIIVILKSIEKELREIKALLRK